MIITILQMIVINVKHNVRHVILNLPVPAVIQI